MKTEHSGADPEFENNPDSCLRRKRAGAWMVFVMTVLSRGEILRHLIAVLGEARLETSPFDHVRLSNVFPVSLYPMIIDNLPATGYYGQLKHSDAVLPSGLSARRKLELRPAQLRHLPDSQRKFWMDIGATLESPELESGFKALFTRALDQRAIRDAKLRPVAMLLRDLGGYKISIHSDTFRKAITTQYYLPVDDSQLHLGTAFHTKNTRECGFSKVKALDFSRNTGYAFPVTAESWHSVEPMKDSDGERNSLMLTYYVRQGLLGETFIRLKRFMQDARTKLSGEGDQATSELSRVMKRSARNSASP